MKRQYVRTTPDGHNYKMSIGGWLDGRNTYLWFGDIEGKMCYGTLSEQKLYRLAKAIVRRFEEAK